MFAKIQFLSRFQEFWNCKIGFFESKKIQYGFVCFFYCKFPTQIPTRKSARAVYEWWNWAKLLTMKNYVHFFCETGAFIRKYQNRFTPANQLFLFFISFSKNFVTEFWNWSIFQKLVQPLKIYFAIQFSALNRVFRFSSPNVIKQRIRISWWMMGWYYNWSHCFGIRY